MPLGVRAGHPTFWQDFGAGARPALALHCSLATGAAWRGVGAALSDRVTITAPDLPGHGSSGDWDGRGDFLDLALRVAASFVEAPVDLIGHSFGAVAALRFAIAAPDMVRTLTLIEPVLFAAVKGTAAWNAHLKALEPFETAMRQGDAALAAASFTRLWGTGVDWQDMAAESRIGIEQRIHLIEAGNPALFEDSGGILHPGALEGLGMPVLLIRGDRSPPIIEAVAEAIAARLPDVGVATVPGAAHMLPITHPDQTAGLIGVNLDRG